MKLKVDHFKQQVEFFGDIIMSNSGKSRQGSEMFLLDVTH